MNHKRTTNCTSCGDQIETNESDDICFKCNEDYHSIKIRTDEEIIQQTIELAFRFASIEGYVIDPSRKKDFRFFYKTRNLRTRKYWEMACIAQEILTETDIENVVDNLEG